MYRIGVPYIEHVGEWDRLCADVSRNNHGVTLWFAVQNDFSPYLTTERSDAFVVALLHVAMTAGEGIECEGPISERLKYQLEEYLIPALARNIESHSKIGIHAETACGSLPNCGAVGTGFSCGVDSFYTVMRHTQPDSLLQLTHVMVANAGVYEGDTSRSTFMDEIAKTQYILQSEDISCSCVAVDTNLHEVLAEGYIEVFSYRLLACALALQKLWKAYLYSSAHDYSSLSFNEGLASSFDVLLLSCLETETLRLYSAGGGMNRVDKLAALAAYSPSYRWVHPCFRRRDVNCGHCKKCRRDMLALYALGALHLYENVYDIEEFERNLDANIAFILAIKDNVLNGNEVIELLREQGIPLSEEALRLSSHFSSAYEQLKQRGGGAE